MIDLNYKTCRISLFYLMKGQLDRNGPGLNLRFMIHVISELVTNKSYTCRMSAFRYKFVSWSFI